MSSTQTPKITIPIVSPPRPSSFPIVAAVGSPTCVGRSIDFGDHPINKENKKNSRKVVANGAVVSPPPKKIKVDFIADAVTTGTCTSAACASATSTRDSSTPKVHKLDRHSCTE